MMAAVKLSSKIVLQSKFHFVASNQTHMMVKSSYKIVQANPKFFVGSSTQLHYGTFALLQAMSTGFVAKSSDKLIP